VAISLILTLVNASRYPFPYSIDVTTLERVDEIKGLGVIMDSRMTFLSHIEAIISESSRMLGFISVFQGNFMTRILIKLCTLHYH
jgi:hypothetical protein